MKVKVNTEYKTAENRDKISISISKNSPLILICNRVDHHPICLGYFILFFFFNFYNYIFLFFIYLVILVACKGKVTFFGLTLSVCVGVCGGVFVCGGGRGLFGRRVVGMQGECFGVGRGMVLCLWLKIPWFWSPLFQFSLQLWNNNITIPISHFGPCLISYDFWNSCLMAIGVPVLGCYGYGCPIHCSFCSFSYRILHLVITSFAQIYWCSFLCLLDRQPLVSDSEFQLFAWTQGFQLSLSRQACKISRISGEKP